MITATAMLWAAWVYVVMSMDPVRTGSLAIVLFAVTLFCAASGTASILGLSLRRYFRRDGMVADQVSTAFRQSLLLASLLLAALFLERVHGLLWWQLMLLLLGAGSVEFFFLRLKRPVLSSRRVGRWRS